MQANAHGSISTDSSAAGLEGNGDIAPTWLLHLFSVVFSWYFITMKSFYFFRRIFERWGASEGKTRLATLR